MIDRASGRATAIVTGAGGGIGRAVAVALSGLGAEICLVGRRAQALRETANELQTPALVVPTDLTRAADVDELAGAVREQWDGLDALVHCAGAYTRGPISTASVDELDRVYTANVQAPYRLTKVMLPMLERQRGDIVFVNSTQALNAAGSVGQYAATRQALKAIADSLRAEVNEFGVRVLTLYLGRTATDRQEEIFAAEGREYRPELLLQPVDVARTIASCLSLGPTAEITDLTIRPAMKTY